MVVKIFILQPSPLPCLLNPASSSPLYLHPLHSFHLLAFPLFLLSFQRPLLISLSSLLSAITSFLSMAPLLSVFPSPFLYFSSCSVLVSFPSLSPLLSCLFSFPSPQQLSCAFPLLLFPLFSFPSTPLLSSPLVPLLLLQCFPLVLLLHASANR